MNSMDCNTCAAVCWTKTIAGCKQIANLETALAGDTPLQQHPNISV
jgi:hypothetical protein